MTKPTDLDENDDDGDDVDVRPVKTKLSGFIIPSIATKRAVITVGY